MATQVGWEKHTQRVFCIGFRTHPRNRTSGLSLSVFTSWFIHLADVFNPVRHNEWGKNQSKHLSIRGADTDTSGAGLWIQKTVQDRRMNRGSKQISGWFALSGTTGKCSPSDWEFEPHQTTAIHVQESCFLYVTATLANRRCLCMWKTVLCPFECGKLLSWKLSWKNPKKWVWIDRWPMGVNWQMTTLVRKINRKRLNTESLCFKCR